MIDVAPELLEKIKASFASKYEQSNVIKNLLKKVEDGKGTYAEANEYAIEVGQLLARAFQDNLSSSVLPEGKMYYNIAKRIIDPTMTNNYELVATVAQRVQQSLNKQANIGIKAIKPKLNESKVKGIIDKVSSDDYDKVSWVLDEPIQTFTQSVVDDAIKSNAEFHYESGMKPKIIRYVAGDCCEWCQQVAGRYTYPDVPKDVYRRHQRCRCTVNYYPGDGKVQNVHTKQWKDTEKIEKRKTINLESKGKNGKINIEADGTTSRIKRSKDGKIVDTYIVKGTPSKKELKYWEFDWSKEESNGFAVSQLFAEGDKRIQGLISTKSRKDLLAVEVGIVESAPFNNPHNPKFKSKEYEKIGVRLFAEAIKQSYEAGFDGFIVFKSKTNLVEYYQKELGAILINPRDRTMCIDEKGAKKLYEEVFK